jgi:hypothetical protein
MGQLIQFRKRALKSALASVNGDRPPTLAEQAREREIAERMEFLKSKYGAQLSEKRGE